MHPPELDDPAQRRALDIGASRSGRLFRKGVWHLIRLVLYRWFKVRGRGAHHLDTSGPLILAPVHRSNLDSPLLATQTPRMIHAIAKESLFSPPPAGWIVSALGAFPVDRGAADRDALLSAQHLLEQGAAVIVFPEGTRQTGNDVGELFDGAAFLAARTGAKVVPIGIAGTEDAMPPGTKIPKRTKVAIVCGEPIDAPTAPEGKRISMKQRRAFTAELGERLQAAFTEAQIEAEQV